MKYQGEESRNVHLDILKCTALCIMPFLHVNSMLTLEGLYADGFPPAWLTVALGLLYNLVPTVFMFCLGSGVVLTRHGQPSALARRGAETILLGLGLNLVRFVPYYLTVGLYYSDAAALQQAWMWLIGSDVLPFAGMSFLFFAAMKKLGRFEWTVLLAGLFFAVGQMLLPVPNSPGTLGHLLGYVIFTEGGESYFPFVSWIIFPCLGYFYQKRLKKMKNPARMHLHLGVVCAALLVISAALLKRRGRWKNRYLLWGEMDFRMDLPAVWFSGLILGLWLSVTYFLSRLLDFRWLRARASSLSKRQTAFYCIHWVVLMSGILIAKLRGKRRVHSLGGFLTAGTAVLTAGLLLSKLWVIFRTSKRS